MHSLLDSAKCVFFDFDGPICRLFPERSATPITDRLRSLVDSRRPDLLTGRQWHRDDPLSVLRAAARVPAAAGLVRAAERQLVAEECQAARTAPATDGAHALIRTLSDIGYTLAITSNNSPEAIQVHLARHGLARHFEPHIHGRRPGDGSLLKPDPDCLRRALASTGAPPGRCLMIGDSPADLVAAERAGVAFLGFARDDHEAEELQGAGAKPECIVDALGAVAEAAEEIRSHGPPG